eukprot:gene15973-18995_t
MSDVVLATLATGSKQQDGPVEQAIRHNRHDVLNFLLDRGMKANVRDLSVFYQCGRDGHLDMIERFVDDHLALAQANSGTRMEILKQALNGAWMSGNLQVAEYVEKIIGSGDMRTICKEMALSYKRAFSNGRLEFFKKVYEWLGANHKDIKGRHKNPFWDWKGFIESGGQVEMVEWMMSKSFAVDMESALIAAVTHGNLALARWITLPKQLEELMCMAISNNHLDMVKYLHKECGITFDGVENSLANITLEMLEYLADNRPDNKPIGLAKVRLNTWPDRRWLDALTRAGMPMDDRFIEFMIVNLDMDEILNILGSDEQTIAKLSTTHMVDTAIDERIDNVKWMLDQNDLSNHVIDRAIKRGHTEIVEYLVERKGFKATPPDFGLAIHYGNVDILKLLVKSNQGVMAVNTSSIGLLAVVQGGLRNMARYLFQQRPHTNEELSIYLNKAKLKRQASTYIAIHSCRNKTIPIYLPDEHNVPLTPIDGYNLSQRD